LSFIEHIAQQGTMLCLYNQIQLGTINS
jgi:hypothetical protein